MHREVSAQHPHLEKSMYTWFLNQRKVGFSVSTSDTITKAVQIEPNFKDEPFAFRNSVPKSTALVLLHSKPHEYDLPYRRSLSQWSRIRRNTVELIMTLCRFIYITFRFYTILFPLLVHLSTAITEKGFLKMSGSYYFNGNFRRSVYYCIQSLHHFPSFSLISTQDHGNSRMN